MKIKNSERRNNFLNSVSRYNEDQKDILKCLKEKMFSMKGKKKLLQNMNFVQSSNYAVFG